MNLSQSNLYEILDALQVDAVVGENIFNIKQTIRVDNGYIDAHLKIEGLHIKETATSLYAILAIGDLGIVMKAKKAVLSRITLIDFKDSVAGNYRKCGDYTALLTHLDQCKWKSGFVLESVECS